MKQFIASTFLFIFISSGFSQTQETDYQRLWDMKDKSIFKQIDSGKFNGTTNGCLQIIKNTDTILLDFQATKSILTINKDIHKMYDNSTKIYSTQTTSGKTTLKYETYALANILTIVLNGERYTIGTIDGASDTPMSGLTFTYFHEKNTEYLTLFVTTALELSTTRYLMESKDMKYPEAEKVSKKIVLLPGSSLIIKMTK